MTVSEDSAWLLGELMGSIQATDEDAIAVGLILETEENVQKFFQWAREQKQDPAPRECILQALRIAEI